MYSDSCRCLPQRIAATGAIFVEPTFLQKRSTFDSAGRTDYVSSAMNNYLILKICSSITTSELRS